MRFRRLLNPGLIALVASVFSAAVCAQSTSGTSSSSKHSSSSLQAQKPAADAGIEQGAVVNGVYRNKALGLSCKVPEGWVLRTEEMSAREDTPGTPEKDPKSSPQEAHGVTEKSRVLLAAFSRPPEARGEDVNSSIVIAAESVEAYPGLKEAAQYFGPLTEVATAQGFTVDEEPYEFEVGAKKVVRGDFHKDVGSRVMRQSSLVWLARGFAISITVIGGTEDEVEELVDGVKFGNDGR